MSDFTPTCRKLRVFSVEPGLGPTRSHILKLKVPWEKTTPGPCGEYVEVIDHDPGSDCFYSPVDLNLPDIVAVDGLPPSEGDPRFHQQSVYALVSSMISRFEHCFGRTTLWAPHFLSDDGEMVGRVVRRLRIYPHALREANAYYSHSKKALLLGYFPARTSKTFPTSFTCLSPAILTHETMHAVLDGMGRLVDPATATIEELAVQEGLSDVISLLFQLCMPGFLTTQVALTTDHDTNDRLLVDLARRLAQPVGVQARFRSAITAGVQPLDPALRGEAPGFQEQAARLVAAIFDAFLAISRRRASHLLKIISGAGPPLTPNQAMVEAVTSEVVKSASHVLNMCIRAIDYCPPVDLESGDYLRALVTADAELVAEDDFEYRDLVADAFRRRGIFAMKARGTTARDLVWPTLDTKISIDEGALSTFAPLIDRASEFDRQNRACDWMRIHMKEWTAEAWNSMGMDKAAVQSSPKVGSLRLAQRGGPHGVLRQDWIIAITQQRRAYLDPTLNLKTTKSEAAERPEFVVTGGCTLVVDARTLEVRYCVMKDIQDFDREERYRQAEARRLSLSTGAEGGRKPINEESFSLLRRGGFELT